MYFFLFGDEIDEQDQKHTKPCHGSAYADFQAFAQRKKRRVPLNFVPALLIIDSCRKVAVEKYA